MVAMPNGVLVAQEVVTTVKLAEQNASGVFGGARITPAGDGQVRVELTLEESGTSVVRPAHIHKGSCANLDPKPAYPLNSVTNGTSDTTVAVSMAELENGGYAINVHKSAAEASVYVACGDIAMMSIAQPEPVGTPTGLGGVPGMPVTGEGNSPGTWTVLLTALGLGAVALGRGLLRQRAK